MKFLLDPQKLEQHKRVAAIEARVQMCKELRAYLRQNRGVFGLIWWRGVSNFVDRWLEDNSTIIEKLKEELGND